MDAYVFDAELVDYPGLSRVLALGGGDTLDDLHRLLRRAFAWREDHLYSFWLDGEFWGPAETEYTSPVDPEEREAHRADVRLDALGLRLGQRIAYVFDFGDEWRVALTVAEIGAVEGALPRIVESRGEAPPQHAPLDEDELGAGG